MKKLVLFLLIGGCTGSRGSSCYENNTCDDPTMVCVRVANSESRCCYLSQDVKVYTRDGVKHDIALKAPVKKVAPNEEN